jgi:hypothetical protein
MHTSKAAFSTFFLILFGACGAPTERVTTADASAPAPRDLGDIDDVGPSALFVWTRDGEGHARSYELDIDGREIRTVDGVLIATKAGVWQWNEKDVVIETSPCERYDDEGALLRAPVPDPGAATRASLVHLSSGAEQVVVQPPADGDGAEDFQQKVELVASVGPLLFVRESTYVYACGAHGSTGASAIVWDASRGFAMPRASNVGSLDAARSEALRELSEDGDGFPATEDTMDFTEIVPRFAEGGALRVGIQFTAPTCYACSRGNGGSYTKSAVVDVADVPSALADYAAAPRGVRAFLSAHPGIEMRGWSLRSSP